MCHNIQTLNTLEQIRGRRSSLGLGSWRSDATAAAPLEAIKPAPPNDYRHARYRRRG